MLHPRREPSPQCEHLESNSQIVNVVSNAQSSSFVTTEGRKGVKLGTSQPEISFRNVYIHIKNKNYLKSDFLIQLILLNSIFLQRIECGF